MEVCAEAPGWHVAVCEGRTVHFPWRAEPARQEGGAMSLTALLLPLLARGNVLGVLALQEPQPLWRQVAPAFCLETLANLAAHALQHAALVHDLFRQREERCTLIEVGQDIGASLDLDEVLRRVVRQATQLMRARMCSLMLVDKRGETFRIRATYGASQTYTQRPPLAIAESLIGNVVRTGMPLAVLDVREHAQYQCLEMARQEGLCSLLSVPLKTNTHVMGVLNVYTTERRRFREEEAAFLSAMAAQSATAIANAQLYQAMLETQERLRQSECLAALGSMAAGLAHEIRNPLHTMQLLISAMQQEYAPHSSLWMDTEVMQHEIRRLTLLAEQFLDFARPAPPQVRCQKLHEIMEDTLLVVGAEARRRNIVLYKHWPQDLPVVWIDAAQLKQVFLNLLLNALQAMPSGGAIDISIYADHQTLTTCIQDQGEGIPAKVQPKLFTPFFYDQTTGDWPGSVNLPAYRRRAWRVHPYYLATPCRHCRAHCLALARWKESMKKILLVDDERNVHYSLQRVLGQAFEVISAFSGEEALQQLRVAQPQVVLLDVKLPGMGGMEVLQQMKVAVRDLPVILLTAYGTTETAITAMKLGAYDYLLKPVDITTLMSLLTKALQLKELTRQAEPVLAWELPEAHALVGRSPAMQDLYKMIGRVAPTDITVLLSGESGTGKELVARALHQHSVRAAGPWVAVNGAAIPEALLESELFGYEKGAFTGASERKPGCFEEASGGTLFLDEVGEIPLVVQAKLLRALQEQEIRRLGGREAIAVDVRIIAATNKNLETAVARKEFREDLYYRLNVIHLHLPPLRARQEDIALLAHAFLVRYSRALERPVRGLPPEALERLRLHCWPGNVRELENTIKQALLTCSGALITAEDLWLEVQAPAGVTLEPPRDPLDVGLEQLLLTQAGDIYNQVEDRLIRKALEFTKYNQVRTAHLLGITRNVLRHRMKQFGLL